MFQVIDKAVERAGGRRASPAAAERRVADLGEGQVRRAAQAQALNLFRAAAWRPGAALLRANRMSK